MALNSMNEKSEPAEDVDCERIVQELRQCVQHGIPEPRTAESARFYRLLFGGNAGAQDCKKQEEEFRTGEPLGTPAQDTHFGVDVVGATFGPAKGAKAAQSPYAKGPAGSVGLTGKGIGQDGTVGASAEH